MSTKLQKYRILTAVEALQLAQLGLGEQIQVRNLNLGYNWRSSVLYNPTNWKLDTDQWLRINDNGDGKGWRIAVE